VVDHEPDHEPLYDNVHFADSAIGDDDMGWHHGKISRMEAERRLQDQGGSVGLFLVRTRVSRKSHDVASSLFSGTPVAAARFWCMR